MGFRGRRLIVEPEGQGAVLLELARSAIEAELIAASVVLPRPMPDWLAAPGAVFVTLERAGALRGCIGTLEARRPLYEDVRANAFAAAFRDPRFPPLDQGELQDLVVEVSLLTPPEGLAVSSEVEACACLDPSRDGVVLRYGEHRATFLPQVWEQLPGAKEFLARLKEKAGLAPDFWHPDIELARYRVRKYRAED